jgi:hypothetical protein
MYIALIVISLILISATEAQIMRSLVMVIAPKHVGAVLMSILM